MLGYVVLFVLFLAACYWILSPLLQEDDSQSGLTPKPEDIANELKNKKNSAYAAIRELEFDLSMGKLTEEDFQILRQKYTQEAIGYMKEMDNLKSSPAAVSKPADAAPEKKNRHKTQIRKQESTSKKHIYCTSCGTKAAIENRFCAVCGSSLHKRPSGYLKEEN